MLRASAVRADEFRVLIRDSNVCFAGRQTFGCKNHSATVPHQGKQRQKEQIYMIYYSARIVYCLPLTPFLTLCFVD